MANATLSRCRRAPELAERFVEGLGQVYAMPITIHPVDPVAVFALAVETGLTAYDAAYLSLSRELGAPLVTLDKQLIAAAQRPRR